MGGGGGGVFCYCNAVSWSVQELDEVGPEAGDIDEFNDGVAAGLVKVKRQEVLGGKRHWNWSWMRRHTRTVKLGLKRNQRPPGWGFEMGNSK